VLPPRMVTAQEHLLHRWLGNSVARMALEARPLPKRFLAIRDC
jgi:transketolase C-terminal domain/subunit